MTKKFNKYTNLEAAMLYAKMGLKILPLHHITPSGACSCKLGKKCGTPGKHPRTPNGASDATNDPNQVQKWFTDYPKANIGWLQGDEFVTVDIDNGKRKKSDGTIINKEGFSALKKVEREHGKRLYSPVQQVSGGGGRHYIFRARKDEVFPKTCPGGDVKHGNAYIVLPPSNHPSGGTYEWYEGSLKALRNRLDEPLPRVPKWFKRSMAGDMGRQQHEYDDSLSSLSTAIRNSKLDMSFEEFSEAVMKIRNDERFNAREDWLNVIASIHHQTDGDEEGFSLACRWSETWDGYHDVDHLQQAWESFGKDSGRRMITARHILKLAKEDGWKSDAEKSIPVSSGLQFISLSDLEDIEDQQDFIEDLLYERQFSVLYGAPGVGKSFFALDIAMHVAKGQNWRDKAVEQGGVLYIALEGVGGVKWRLHAWAKAHNVKLKSIPMLLGCGTLTLVPDSKGCKQIIDACSRLKNPVKLIIIDTLARSIAGGDENSSQDMSAVVGAVDLLRESTGAHVMLVHHSGKDQSKGARGHSSLRGAVDTEIRVTKSESRGKFVAEVTKQKDGEIGEKWHFSLKGVDLNRVNRRGKPISSAAIRSGPDFEKLPEVKHGRYAAEARRAIDDIVDPEKGMALAKLKSHLKSLESFKFDKGHEGTDEEQANDTINKRVDRAIKSLEKRGIVNIDQGLVTVVKQPEDA